MTLYGERTSSVGWLRRALQLVAVWIALGLSELRADAPPSEWDALARIDAIPQDLLPDGSDARDKLVALALVEHDVDAYQVGWRGEWVIYCRPEWPCQDGRYTIERWQRACAAEHGRIMAEIASENREEWR